MSSEAEISGNLLYFAVAALWGLLFAFLPPARCGPIAGLVAGSLTFAVSVITRPWIYIVVLPLGPLWLVGLVSCGYYAYQLWGPAGLSLPAAMGAVTLYLSRRRDARRVLRLAGAELDKARACPISAEQTFLLHARRAFIDLSGRVSQTARAHVCQLCELVVERCAGRLGADQRRALAQLVEELRSSDATRLRRGTLEPLRAALGAV